MREIFRITNKYIILATPLILFSLFLTIYTVISNQSAGLIHSVVNMIITTIMFAAFVSGWFKMIKLAVSASLVGEPNLLIKEFPAGVGEYFLPVLSSVLVLAVLNILILLVAVISGSHLIGEVGITPEAFSGALSSQQSLTTFLGGLSQEQLTKLGMWNVYMLGWVTLISFCEMLYYPVMIFKTKNPFRAISISLKELFSKYFFKTLCVFVLIFVVNFIITIPEVLFSANLVVGFITTMIRFYFFTIVAVGLFYYYYQQFVKSNLGNNIDTYI
ncbi:MAG: hypothetical protein MJ237_01450 [bacterium]|nr:hypothetical protein [bacterium]